MNRLERFGALLALWLLFATENVHVMGWSPNQKAFARTNAGRKQPTMYMPPNGPTSQPPHFTAQKMLKNPGNPRISEPARKTTIKLSNSVLASCDTLPSFPTAHGLLSPETVMRLEDLTPRNQRCDALVSFLDTYRRHGPLSCLPMLSDPDILPRLTEAMRDIAA